MTDSWYVYGIGFCAQLLFASRMFMQWSLSEKAKKVVNPNIYWWLSLIGTFFLFAYGYFRADFAIMMGQTLTYFIYIRNLQLKQEWSKLPVVLRWFLFATPVLVVIYGFNNGIYEVEVLFQNAQISTSLLALGISAQLIFTFRFVYQWIFSEKHQESVLPIGFWILSTIGSLLILIYAFYRKDPVLIFGHIAGIFIYIRNLKLAYAEINESH